MKRCPKCNRVETDEALKFCRVDGATLINDSGSVNGDAGTVKFGSGAVSSEIETSILLHTTDTSSNRPTVLTTVLGPPLTPGITRGLSKSKRLGVVISLTALAVVGLLLPVTSSFHEETMRPFNRSR